jgi:hypothetical protein
MSTGLNTEPHFSDEMQEVVVEGCRIYAVKDTQVVKAGAEGTYLGRTKHGAFVAWDTPDGNGYRVTVSFDAIRNLYR